MRMRKESVFEQSTFSNDEYHEGDSGVTSRRFASLPVKENVQRSIRNVEIQGRRTSMGLEKAFWDLAADLANRDRFVTVNSLFSQAVQNNPDASMSCAVRCYLLGRCIDLSHLPGVCTKVRQNLVLRGKRTSVSIEQAYWEGLRLLCQEEERSLDEVFNDLALIPSRASMTSNLRVGVLLWAMQRAGIR